MTGFDYSALFSLQTAQTPQGRLTDLVVKLANSHQIELPGHDLEVNTQTVVNALSEKLSAHRETQRAKQDEVQDLHDLFTHGTERLDPLDYILNTIPTNYPNDKYVLGPDTWSKDITRQPKPNPNLMFANFSGTGWVLETTIRQIREAATAAGVDLKTPTLSTDVVYDFGTTFETLDKG